MRDKNLSLQEFDTETEPAHPFIQLNDTVLALIAHEVGMTLSELKVYLAEPHVVMTCPLCGNAHSSLVTCQGCGLHAWQAAEDVMQRLRDGLAVTLQATLHQTETPEQEAQIEQAVRHAYQPGGCMICAPCWQTILSSIDDCNCPLYLHADHTLVCDGFDPCCFLPKTNRQKETVAHLDEQTYQNQMKRWAETWA